MGRCARGRLKRSFSRNGACVGCCQSARAKIFHFTEIRFWRMCRPSRLTRRGDLEVVLIASRACGGRGSVGMRGAGRAGSPCEPAAACRRAALLGFVSPVSLQFRRQGWKYCGDMAGRAYGKTVWSWPSLLRSSRIEDAREPNRVDGIIQFERRGRPKESSAPGRARHKPSDHRAGKAE